MSRRLSYKFLREEKKDVVVIQAIFIENGIVAAKELWLSTALPRHRGIGQTTGTRFSGTRSSGRESARARTGEGAIIRGGIRSVSIVSEPESRGEW